MKHFIYFATIFLFTISANAQVGIADDSGVDDFTVQSIPNGAVFEVRSNNRAMIIPRLETITIQALSPIEGMVVFDTTLQCFKGYGNGTWQILGDDCLAGPNVPPTASSVGIEDATEHIVTQIEAGETLSGTYTYADADADLESGSTYRWFSATDANGTGASAITGATSQSYTTTLADIGDYIGFCVTPNDGIAYGVEECSPTYVLVTAPPITTGCDNPTDLVEFGFDGDTGDVIEEPANDTASHISNASIIRGNGLTPSPNADRFNAKGGTETSLSDAIQANDYFEVNFDIASGYTADISAFEFNWRRTEGGANNVVIRSSVDGFSSDLGTFLNIDDSDNNIVDLTGNALHTATSGTVTFRIYAWGATTAGGSFGFEGDGRDLKIIGCTNYGTPEPIVEFTQSTATVGENGGTQDITFHVINQGNNDITVNINITTTNASTGDYSTTVPATFTIPAGATVPTYTITGIDDALLDPAETVTYQITTVSSATASPQIGPTNTLEVTITDDEVPALPLVYTQNFDGTTVSNALNFIDEGTGRTFSGSGPHPSGANYVSGPNGYGVKNGTMNLIFGDVDTSFAHSASVTFRLASFSETTTNGADGADNVKIYVSSDYGITWSQELELSGNSNTRYDFSASDAYTATHGDGNADQITTSAHDYSILTVDNLPIVPFLRLRIEAKNNSSNEIWIIDDVVLTLN